MLKRIFLALYVFHIVIFLITTCHRLVVDSLHDSFGHDVKVEVSREYIAIGEEILTESVPPAVVEVARV